jgi:hypothetical protein
VDADLDTLATALYVRTDDLLKEFPERAPWRPAIGITPELSDAELLTLAVMQALLGFVSESRWLRYARKSLRGCPPACPASPGTTSGYASWPPRARRAARIDRQPPADRRADDGHREAHRAPRGAHPRDLHRGDRHGADGLPGLGRRAPRQHRTRPRPLRAQPARAGLRGQPQSCPLCPVGYAWAGSGHRPVSGARGPAGRGEVGAPLFLTGEYSRHTGLQSALEPAGL